MDKNVFVGDILQNYNDRTTGIKKNYNPALYELTIPSNKSLAFNVKFTFKKKTIVVDYIFLSQQDKALYQYILSQNQLFSPFSHAIGRDSGLPILTSNTGNQQTPVGFSLEKASKTSIVQLFGNLISAVVQRVYIQE